jgi:four helix bundle protein
MPANIARGHGRDDLGENLPGLSVANGSWMALETLLLAAPNAGYVKGNDLASARAPASKAGRMRAGLRKGLKA